MYLDPSPITPFALAWLGLFAIGIGALLMMDAAREARRLLHPISVERNVRFGARICLGGIALLVVSGGWAVLG